MTGMQYNVVTGGRSGTCPWCKAQHVGLKCALVSAVEFHPDGTVKRVEFVRQSIGGSHGETKPT